MQHVKFNNSNKLFWGETCSIFTGILTLIITAVGLSFFGGALANGDVSNITPLFKDGNKGVLTVAVMTPFMYVGFGVIPQAAEEEVIGQGE